MLAPCYVVYLTQDEKLLLSCKGNATTTLPPLLIAYLRRKGCPLFAQDPLACKDVNCKLQHIPGPLEQPDTPIPQDCLFTCVAPAVIPMSVVPGSAADLDFVRRLCDRTCENAQVTVTNVEVVQGTMLLKRYNDRKKALPST